jgi:GTP-binding protein
MTLKITSATFHACVVGKDGLPEDNLPIIALVGRSNVGKSSLINSLANRKELARTSSLPGKTLTINFYLINESFYLVDLPGYGYAKASKVTRSKIQAMMNEFFGESENLKGVIQILDVRHKPSALDKQMLSWIRDQKFNYLAILTKADKLSNQQLMKMRKTILKDIGVDFALGFSSKTKAGRDEVLDALEKITSGFRLTSLKPSKPQKPPKGTKAGKSGKPRKTGDRKRPAGNRDPKTSESNKKETRSEGSKPPREKGGKGNRRRRRPSNRKKDPKNPNNENKKSE